MIYLYKHLTKEIFKNKIFITLMFILVLFTSFMYYFVHFSIDANIRVLRVLPYLSENQLAYQNGMLSNIILARNILIAFIGLTSFVFVMFFYRFFKASSKQLGCLKSLGFKDQVLSGYFVIFTLLISLSATLIGLVTGYFISDVLIQSSIQSYNVTNLIKSLNLTSILVGLLVPTSIFCFIAFFSYGFLQRKETALLISNMDIKSTCPVILLLANKIARFYPKKDKFPMRLALRKPIALLLIILSVMSFSTMFILAYSLNLSSQQVFQSQTQGHNYLYDAHFDTPQYEVLPATDFMAYLDASGRIEYADTSIRQALIGLEKNSSLFTLLDSKGNTLESPPYSRVIISSALQELYGFQVGDEVLINVGETIHTMTISDIAFNAKLNSIYISKNELAQMLSLPDCAYTGLWSMQNIPKVVEGIDVTTHTQKIQGLERSFVSNRISALINQVIGCLIGCMLLFLALLLNFQDSTRDMLILHLLGYQPKAIRKMLVDLYKPILWLFFLLTLWPAIQIVKSVLRSLSIQIGDYMPFQTNIFVIVGIFALLNIVYLFVQSTFNIGIKKLIKKDMIYEYTNND